jgi:hypothetical protein
MEEGFMFKVTQLWRGVAIALVLVPFAYIQKAKAIDWNVSGFIRQEGAFSLDSGKENYYNQGGNIFNDIDVPNQLAAPVQAALRANVPGLEAFVAPDVTNRQQIIYSADGNHQTKSFAQDNDWNLIQTRFEIDVGAKVNDNLKFVTKLRGVYVPDEYDNHGDVNYFETPFRGDCGTRLESCGENYMVDLPSLYADYTNGPLWLRIGNQQIAWGEAIFFRVLDTANALDLRRHSVFDFASEEYSDKRVPSLGVRGSYSFKNDWELEAWTQESQVNILSNENTPYNVITSTFVVHQEEGFDEIDDEWNTGVRLRGQVGDLGLQFTYTDRINPDGAFRWTESGVNVIPTDSPLAGFGPLLQGSPFEPATGGQGVWSARQWIEHASAARLDGLNIQDILDDLPLTAAAVGGFYATAGFPAPATYNDMAATSGTLDAFFAALGEFRGHIERNYHREQIVGLGANYIFFAEPDTWLDQLIVRAEATFTEDRVFTDPSLLGKDYRVEDELIASLVVEKYHRFSRDFPATYMVLQYLHKSESDMFGRHLDGYGATADNPRPTGRDGFDAVSFALQQPSPTLTWRTDLAVLYDLEGGYLVQPGVRWKPNASMSAEVFANFVDGGDDNMDQMSSFDYVEELSFRLTFQY